MHWKKSSAMVRGKCGAPGPFCSCNVLPRPGGHIANNPIRKLSLVRRNPPPGSKSRQGTTQGSTGLHVTMDTEEESGDGAAGAPTSLDASPPAKRRVTGTSGESSPAGDSAERTAGGSSGTAPTASSRRVAREAEGAVPVPTGREVPTETENTGLLPLERVAQSATSTVDETALAAVTTAPEDVEKETTPPCEDVPRPAVPTAPRPDESVRPGGRDDGNTGNKSMERHGRGASDPEETGSARSQAPTDASPTAAPSAPSAGDAADASASPHEPAGCLAPRLLAVVQPEDPADESMQPTETTTPCRPSLGIAPGSDRPRPSPDPDYVAAGVLPFCILGGDLLFLLGQQHRFTSRSRSASLLETGKHPKGERGGREGDVVAGQVRDGMASHVDRL